jgi:RNA polymerase sigma-70 factor, ECF subfamily
MTITTSNRREAHKGFGTLFSSSSALADSVDGDLLMRRIEYRVGRLGRKYGLSTEDRQDIRQEFCLTLFRAGERYKPERCTPERYIRMVLNRCYKHWVRKLARADDNRARSVDTLHFDDVEPDLEYYIVDPKGEDDHRRVDVREDVRTVLAGLPDDLRGICLDLMSDSPFQVAKDRGVHHSAIYRAIAKIREHFRHAGIEEIS